MAHVFDEMLQMCKSWTSCTPSMARSRVSRTCQSIWWLSCWVRRCKIQWRLSEHIAWMVILHKDLKITYSEPDFSSSIDTHPHKHTHAYNHGADISISANTTISHMKRTHVWWLALKKNISNSVYERHCVGQHQDGEEEGAQGIYNLPCWLHPYNL